MKPYIRNIILLSIIVGLLTSCFKEDIKVYIPPLLGSDIVVLGNSYNSQVWVDLNGFDHKATHKIDSWDLAFSSDANSFDVRLNSAKMMYAGTNEIKDFENVTSEEGISMTFDASSGNTDSLAFGGWYEMNEGASELAISKGYIYVVNRGFDESLNELGYKKVSINILDGNYVIRYANLDGSEENSLTIPKDDSFNYIHFSFENQIIQIEPPQNEWSLKFSRYSTILTTNAGDPYDYNVVGVLLNPYKVLAAETDTLVHPYESIQLPDTIYYQFTNQNDLIGYDWKDYDDVEDFYEVYTGKSYIIKDRDGYFYKLHFISFYDAMGNKGSIKYQIERL